MQRPARGRILFRGHDIAGWPSHRVCNLGIGQVAEGRQVFPTLSVVENLRMGAMLPRRAGAAAAPNLDRVMALFPVLAERLAQAAGTLSGGEQQMLAIGRCLMGAPELVMFDEPSLGLAPAVVQDVLRTIRDLNREGLTCLLVEQNVALSLKLARRAYVLENGRITLMRQRRGAAGTTIACGAPIWGCEPAISTARRGSLGGLAGAFFRQVLFTKRPKRERVRCTIRKRSTRARPPPPQCHASYAPQPSLLRSRAGSPAANLPASSNRRSQPRRIPVPIRLQQRACEFAPLPFHFTLRFSADVLPRLVTSSYSTC